jgi:nucleoside-diphosphate-sugar epimerase
VLGTINLARVALKSNISKFVLVSTSHVYAKSNRLLFEHSKVSPLSEYAEQKLQAEQAITEMFKDFPTKLCIVRVFSVLDWDTPQYTLGDTVRKIVLGDPNAFVRFVDDIRDFLTPEQVANSLIKIAKTENLTGIVNLSSAQGMTVFDAVSVMLELAGVGLKADLLHRGKSEIPRIVGSNSKLKNQIPDLELSWSPSPFKS